MNLLKRTLINIPFFRSLSYFRRRYNEPHAVSFLKYSIFNTLPVSFLGLIYKKEDYMPFDKYSSLIRGNVFMGACARAQRSGCYIQGRGKVFIGDYVEVASNVVVISGNHDLYNQDIGVEKETIIGDYCWLASNVSILAGVVLGPRTIVGAGSVVTKSFPEGNCVIAGNPAKIIKTLDPAMVIKAKDEHEFYGYLPKAKFQKWFLLKYRDLRFEYPLDSISNNEYVSNLNSHD